MANTRDPKRAAVIIAARPASLLARSIAVTPTLLSTTTAKPARVIDRRRRPPATARAKVKSSGTPRPKIRVTQTAKAKPTPSPAATRSRVGATLAANKLLANPTLSAHAYQIRPFVATTALAAIGTPRSELEVPVCTLTSPSDTVLFEAPDEPSKKLYLPRYGISERDGRYDMSVQPSKDGAWRLQVNLQKHVAPELEAKIAGAGELPHQIAVFFSYGAGPTGAIKKRVDFTEVETTETGLVVSVRLSTAQRDSLLIALQSSIASPQLVVSRAAEVATPVTTQGSKQQKPPVLVGWSKGHTAQAKASPRASVAVKPMAAIQARAFRANAAAVPGPALQQNSGSRTTTPSGATPQAERFMVKQHVLQQTADPNPVVLDPRLHAYFYESIGGSSRVTDNTFRRVTLPHASSSGEQRFHAYFQDSSQPWVFYYLADCFRLSRCDEAPHLIQMAVRIASPNGEVENAHVTLDYLAEPSLDLNRLAAAEKDLVQEIPKTAEQREVELRPLQAQARLRVWLPASGGNALTTIDDLSIDLANGFTHSLSLPLDQFRQLYGSAFAKEANSLFTGEVLVETGNAEPEHVPFEIRFAKTEGEVLEILESPDAGGEAVNLTISNAIESTLQIAALPVRLQRAEQSTEGTIEALDFDEPKVLAPGEELQLRVLANEPLPGEGPLDAIVDTSHVQVLPEPSTVLPTISDESVPASYTRPIEVLTLDGLLGSEGDPNEILLIVVEFRGGESVKITRTTMTTEAEVALPLIDLLLGKDNAGRYAYKQQIVRRSGAREVDEEWCESDFGTLVVPAQ